MNSNIKHPGDKVRTMSEISEKTGFASHPVKMLTITKSAACGPSEIRASGLSCSVAGNLLRKLWESGVYSNTPAPYDPYTEILKCP